MPRKPRHVEPGGYYHVTSRGNNRGAIQLDAIDCVSWESRLARVVSEFRWKVLAFVLMTNHFHLVLRLPELGLSEGMQMLNGEYAKEFNRRHGRENHLFGRRFWSKQIRSDAHLIQSIAYNDLNPLRGGLVERPEDYRFSSHAPLIGLREPPPFLAVDEVLGLFPLQPAKAQLLYRSYVRGGGIARPGATETLRVAVPPPLRPAAVHLDVTAAVSPAR